MPLLMPDDEFIMGGSLREVKEALELRHPSPVPGASMIEICNSSELKRHTMPFGDPVIVTVKKNPDYAMQRWGDKYVTYLETRAGRNTDVALYGRQRPAGLGRGRGAHP